MSYLGFDQEDCVEIKRYALPEVALAALGRFLHDLEHRYQEIPPTHFVEVFEAPTPPSDEQWEREMADDTEIM